LNASTACSKKLLCISASLSPDFPQPETAERARCKTFGRRRRRRNRRSMSRRR